MMKSTAISKTKKAVTSAQAIRIMHKYMQNTFASAKVEPIITTAELMSYLGHSESEERSRDMYKSGV